MAYYFVADIGGTNARFGCVNQAAPHWWIEHAMALRNEEFNSVDDLIRTYFAALPEMQIKGGCLAIAGPVIDDQINITNLGWSFSIAELQQCLQLSELVVINDFVGLAHSLAHLSAEALTEIIAGQGRIGATRLVLGPGTGLGVAALLGERNGRHSVIDTEAGHIGFAPSSDVQVEVLKAMRRQCDYVPIEDLISGTGLPDLYQVLTRIQGKPAERLSATQITDHAAAGSEPICVEVVALFCAMLASFAGDMALCFHASGGVYLGGGLLPKLPLPLIVDSFKQQFSNKGRMSHLLAETPVYLIKPGNAALIGASSYYRTRLCAPA